MGKIAESVREWIWPELRDQKNHVSMLKAGIEVQRGRINDLESQLAEKILKLEKLQRERAAFIKPNTPEVLRNVTAAQIRRMTEKEGDQDGV